MFEAKKNKIFTEKGEIYEAPGYISSALAFKNKLILMYKILPEERHKFDTEDLSRNVLCLELDGTITWKLEPPEKGTLSFNPSYIKLYKTAAGEFITHDGGYTCRFDPETGKILERDFTK